MTGTVSAANSLVGSTTDDGVDTVTALANGNYAVCSRYPDTGAAVDTGGRPGGMGRVDHRDGQRSQQPGGQHDGRFGDFNVMALANGNYVVRSPDWNNGGR